MTALNSTVGSVPARERVFILTDANARTGKRGEGGGESDSNVLRACGQGKLNKNGKLLLGFTEGNKLAPRRQPQQGASTSRLCPAKASKVLIGPLH